MLSSCIPFRSCAHHASGRQHDLHRPAAAVKEPHAGHAQQQLNVQDMRLEDISLDAILSGLTGPAPNQSRKAPPIPSDVSKKAVRSRLQRLTKVTPTAAAPPVPDSTQSVSAPPATELKPSVIQGGPDPQSTSSAPPRTRRRSTPTAPRSDPLPAPQQPPQPKQQSSLPPTGLHSGIPGEQLPQGQAQERGQAQGQASAWDQTERQAQGQGQWQADEALQGHGHAVVSPEALDLARKQAQQQAQHAQQGALATVPEFFDFGPMEAPQQAQHAQQEHSTLLQTRHRRRSRLFGVIKGVVQVPSPSVSLRNTSIATSPSNSPQPLNSAFLAQSLPTHHVKPTQQARAISPGGHPSILAPAVPVGSPHGVNDSGDVLAGAISSTRSRRAQRLGSRTDPSVFTASTLLSTPPPQPVPGLRLAGPGLRLAASGLGQAADGSVSRKAAAVGAQPRAPGPLRAAAPAVSRLTPPPAPPAAPTSSASSPSRASAGAHAANPTNSDAARSAAVNTPTPVSAAGTTSSSLSSNSLSSPTSLRRPVARPTAQHLAGASPPVFHQPASLHPAVASSRLAPSARGREEPVMWDTWRTHAQAAFPSVYSPGYHTSLYEFFFDMWPAVGKALDRGRMAEALAGFRFLFRCAASPQRGVRHTGLVSLAECVGDADALEDALVKHVQPRALFLEALVPLVAWLHADELGPSGELRSFWLTAQAMMMDNEHKPEGSREEWQALIAELQRMRVAYPAVPLGALLTLSEGE